VDYVQEGVACMAGRSLGTRLELLTNLLVLTGLILSHERPDLRTPGVPEQGPPAGGRWCSKCGRTLEEEAMPSGSIYSCLIHGPLDEEDIRSSLPDLWCRECDSKLELEPIPSCPTHGAIDVADILTSPPGPRL
jgi:hypothetical protein